MIRTNDSARKRAKQAADELLQRVGQRPRVALLLGTGHAAITGQLKNKVTISNQELPSGMAHGDHSNLVAGELEGVPLVIADAPLGAFEGYTGEELSFPVRVLRAMGCETLVLTAAAASLSHQLEPGSLALVEDHINLSGVHPLHGPNDDELGPRFPDMSQPYSEVLAKRARRVADEIGVSCLPGVFAAVPGPSLPTRAEYRFLARAGADLVGMSLVPEVVAAVHSGFDVLALVAVTQQVAISSREPVDIEAMLDAADLAAPRIASLVTGIVASMNHDG